MKNIILRLFLASVACFLSLNPKAFSQESRLSNSGQLEVVMPNYHYEYIPDFTYEE
jgi:membrane-bound lytic murein transglycosylase D